MDDQRLDARVAALEAGQNQLLKAVHDLGRKLDDRSATPWRAVIAAGAAGVVLAGAAIKPAYDSLGHLLESERQGQESRLAAAVERARLEERQKFLLANPRDGE